MMKMNFGKFDPNILVENYNKALKDADFREKAEATGLHPEELMKYTSKIELSVEEARNCKGCKSLHECQNKIRGYVHSPVVTDERLYFKYIACPYEQNRLREEKSACRYFEIPESLKLARMKDIYSDDANRLPVIKWLKNFYDSYQTDKHQKGLYLHGSFGSGKTYVICAMLNELSRKGADITIVYYPELLRSLKESFDKEDFPERLSRIKKADILFLDDIGAEFVTPWARDEILGTILQYRMDASLPTFFTSNLTIEELEANLSNTKNDVDKVKARRIIERIKKLTTRLELVSKDRRN